MTGAPPKLSDFQKPLPGAPVIGFSDWLGVAGLSVAMREALDAMQRNGDVEYRTYRWNNGLLCRGEWRDMATKDDAPRIATLDALKRRGLVEEYTEMKYCGHGEYDDWQCWRLATPNAGR